MRFSRFRGRFHRYVVHRTKAFRLRLAGLCFRMLSSSPPRYGKHKTPALAQIRRAFFVEGSNVSPCECISRAAWGYVLLLSFQFSSRREIKIALVLFFSLFFVFLCSAVAFNRWALLRRNRFPHRGSRCIRHAAATPYFLHTRRNIWQQHRQNQQRANHTRLRVPADIQQPHAVA